MAAPKGQVPWNAGTSQGWTDKRGYRWRYITVGGKRRAIREHRYIMREHLGRELEAWEIVHHKDGDPSNNALSNLEIVEVTEHNFHHHNGAQRGDNAKKSLRIYAQMREEIRHLRGVNTALLEALEAFIADHLAEFKAAYPYAMECQCPRCVAARAAIRQARGGDNG